MCSPRSKVPEGRRAGFLCALRAGSWERTFWKKGHLQAAKKTWSLWQQATGVKGGKKRRKERVMETKAKNRGSSAPRKSQAAGGQAGWVARAPAWKWQPPPQLETMSCRGRSSSHKSPRGGHGPGLGVSVTTEVHDGEAPQSHQMTALVHKQRPAGRQW